MISLTHVILVTFKWRRRRSLSRWMRISIMLEGAAAQAQGRVEGSALVLAAEGRRGPGCIDHPLRIECRDWVLVGPKVDHSTSYSHTSHDFADSLLAMHGRAQAVTG